MATRSRIAVMHGEKCKSVYCHFDGYISGVGKTLLEHYDSAKANQLVALGDISVLAPTVEVPTGSTHSWEFPEKHITLFYGRDRKDANTDFRVDYTFEGFLDRVYDCGAEYYYVMRDGVWYAGSVYGELEDKLVPLVDIMEKEEA